MKDVVQIESRVKAVEASDMQAAHADQRSQQFLAIPGQDDLRQNESQEMATFVNTLVDISKNLYNYLEQIQEEKDGLHEELSSKQIQQVQLETEVASLKSQFESLHLQKSCIQRELNIRDVEKSTLDNIVTDLRQKLNEQVTEYHDKIQELKNAFEIDCQN